MLVWSSFNILNPENKSISNNILEALAFCKQCSGAGNNAKPSIIPSQWFFGNQP